MTLATQTPPTDAAQHLGSESLARQGSAMDIFDQLIERLAAEMTTIRGALRTLRMTTHIAKNPTRLFPDVVEELVDRYGDSPALLSDRESFTYREFATRTNRYARWALAQDLAKGDTICLLMPNRPEFLAFWVGVTRIGGVVALLNTNLAGKALAHCINVVNPKHIVVAAELLLSLKSAQSEITVKPKVWLHGPGDADLPRLDQKLDGFAGDKLVAAERRALTIEDRALYIYTSGTTGLPKAANMNHYRVMLASHAFAGVMDVQASDRMYDCLPMYHTAGGLLATGPLLIMGGSVVLREKFSAHEFWNDIVGWDCTLLQYIGEFCRYLVNSPPQPQERAHRLRLVCGNGLRPDVWPQFKERFNIPQIIEFYAATEGNVTLFNFEGREGAVGRIPWYLESRFPTRIVRFDVELQQPVRDGQGFCIACDDNEAGEVIGRILKDASKPGARFEGYASQVETDKKILRDVFQKGDVWFRTGDLMRRDGRGYFYFVDRIGDTFRWKGENVSTTEVQEAIGAFGADGGMLEANVYGVSVPGREGRAGMAALLAPGNFDLDAFRDHLAARLPDYAQPVFLRIRREIEVTTTFKQKKVDLVKQGFNPKEISDPIYFNDSVAKAFVRLDGALYESICGGHVRL
ncbi:MAG TPA: long-chain-acyl-CoA synthetase [Xanthobacteraceae bacterium]|jgi:fatty-acyl-CoA synthase|nr:long-chain-acyl-CoA synthetase [Xanthobacteraceae bacterium]